MTAQSTLPIEKINRKHAHAFLLANAMHDRKSRIELLGGSIPTAKRGRTAKRCDLLERSPLSEKLMDRYIKSSMDDRVVDIFKGNSRIDSKIYYRDYIAALNKRYERRRYGALVDNSAYVWIKDLQNRKIERPEMEILLLDTSYVNSIVAEGESIKNAILGLKEAIAKRMNENFEIVITREVYEELTAQLNGANGAKKDEYGRAIMTSKALNELHELIGNGVVCLEEFTADEKIRSEFSEVLKRRNRRKNSRVGNGEASILKYIKNILNGLNNISFKIFTKDSDIGILLRGCEGVIKVMNLCKKKEEYAAA
jgi:hypothetical protein